MKTSPKNSIKNFLCGAITGLCNGLFGAGGGNVAVFTLQHILKMRADAAHASAICIILPLSTISAIGYIAGGAVEYKWLPFVVPAFFAGGILGAKLLGKISGIWLNRLFSFLMLLCAVFMVVL